MARAGFRGAGVKHVWIITAVVMLFGLANGVMINAAPQLALALGFSSSDIGMVGAGLPLGYAASCLLFFWLHPRTPGKYVLLGGVLGALVSMLGMAWGRSVFACVAAQLAFGASGGAFWPFASAWLLDFQADGISKQRLLRHYNVGWTSGTATGMFLSGWLCEAGHIHGALYAGAAINACAFLIGLAARATQPAGGERLDGAAALAPASSPRIGWPLLVAAVAANLVALGTRQLVLSNYAELNQALVTGAAEAERVAGAGAARLGMITSLGLLSQVVCFAIGFVYEPWLGLRRVYIVLAFVLIAVNLSFVYAKSPAWLAGAVTLHGLVLAMAFQTAIFAATAFFSTPRAGTTFHEAVVGCSGVASLGAGVLIDRLKAGGLAPETALRAPFVVLAAATAVLLAVQLALVGSRSRDRLLLESGGTRRQ
jgi:predicted MFS family arabinose efflux permease